MEVRVWVKICVGVGVGVGVDLGVGVNVDLGVCRSGVLVSGGSRWWVRGG